MNKRITGLIFVLAILAGPAWADRDIDQSTVRELSEQGAVLPLEDILQKVQKIKPGRVMEVELKNKHGRYIYEVEIVDSNGRVWEFKVDASNGSVISHEQDD